MSAMHVSFVVFCHSELAFPEACVVQAGAWLLRCREDPNRPSYNQTGKKPPLQCGIFLVAFVPYSDY